MIRSSWILCTLLCLLCWCGTRTQAQELKVKPEKRNAFDYALQVYKAADYPVEKQDVTEMPVLEEMEMPRALYPVQGYRILNDKQNDREPQEAALLQFKDHETLKKFLNTLSAKDNYPSYVLIQDNAAFISQSSEVSIIPFSKPFSTGGYPELFTVIEKGDLEALKQLQANGLDLKKPRFAMQNTIWPVPGEEFYPDATHFADMNTLHLAIYYGHIPMVDYLLTQGFSLKDTLSSNNWPSGEEDMDGFWQKVPALTIPIPSGKDLMTNHLMNKGADVNAQDHSGFPFLYEAASYARVGIIEAAMKKGADPKVIYKHTGEGILHYADDLSTIELLLKAGADASIIDKEGVSVLMYNGGTDEEVAKLLIKAGANPKAIDKEGQNLFFHYIEAQLIPFYVKHGVDVNQRNKKGETALYYVWDAETATAFLKAGLDPKIKSNEGKTALDHLKEQGVEHRLLEVLEEAMKK